MTGHDLTHEILNIASIIRSRQFIDCSQLTKARITPGQVQDCAEECPRLLNQRIAASRIGRRGPKGHLAQFPGRAVQWYCAGSFLFRWPLSVKSVVPDVPIEDIFKGALPFLIVDFINLAMLIFIPQIILFLPSLML